MGIVKFILGVIGLLFVTASTAVFGIGGFFFSIALIGIGFWAFGGK